MGIAAPQIGIGCAAVVVQPPGDGPSVILLNPKITDRSDETDEQYEVVEGAWRGCRRRAGRLRGLASAGWAARQSPGPP
ncbi:peptide deformylase [Streptomyces sp. NPDC127190]|uniref:peptide deformylase n=1 Tax=unclassified Streptomyces TaxID=2593676 RepID=UPI0036376D82